MPNLSDVMHRVGRARLITVCDAKFGYYQLEVRPQDRWLTAFATHRGLWEWVRMPFGLKSAGSSFVWAIQLILQPIRDFTTDSYVDDEFETHLRDLEQFFGSIRSSGLTLNLRKCHFAEPEVKYLGHLVGSGCHRPDPDRLKAVSEMKPPATKKELRQMLDFFSCYRAYAIDFARIAKPLTDLTGKHRPTALQWGDAQQCAFETLRRLVCEAPICSVPIPIRPFQLHTDTSAVAVGCMLSQLDDEGSNIPWLKLVLS